MSRMAFKWLKRLLYSVLVFLLSICLLVVVLLFTQPGLNLVLWGTEQALPQFQVDQAEGAIFPQFTLYNTSFNDSSYALKSHSRKITIAVEPRCFLTSSVCISKIEMDGLNVSLPQLPAKNEQVKTTEPVSKVQTPIPVTIDRIEFKNSNLDILGNNIKWERFTSGLAFQASSLTIYPTMLQTLMVGLAKDESDKKTQTNHSSRQAIARDKPIQLPEISIPLDIDIQQFDLKQFTLQGDVPIRVNQLGMSAHMIGQAVDVRQLDIDLPEADASLQAKVTLTEDYPVQLNATIAVKQSELAGQKIELSASGSVAEMALTSELSGVVNASIEGDIQPLQPELPFDVALTKGKLQWPLKGKPQYQIDVSALQLMGSLKSYRLSLATKLEGSDIPDVVLDIEGKGNLQQIDLEAIQVDTLGGEVSGQVMVNWQSPLNWSAALGLQNIQPGLQWTQAEGTISGSLVTSGELLSGGGWRIRLPVLDIEGIVRNYPLDIQGSFEAADDKAAGGLELTTQGLSIKHGANGVQVSGRVDKEWNMDSVIHFPELNKSIPDVRGQIKGELSLRGQREEPRLETDLTAEQISYKKQISISQLQLGASVLPLPQPDGQLNLYIKNMKYQGKIVDSIDLTLAGTQKYHELSFIMLSELLNATVHINGNLDNVPDMVWKGGVNKAEFSTPQGPWRLDKRVKLSVLVKEQLAKISAHCWSQAESQVCLTQNLSAGKTGEVNVDVQNFNFNQLKMFVPPQTQLFGEVNATAIASWGVNKDPDVDIAIRLPKGRVIQTIEQPVELGWESVTLNASLHNNRLKSDWQFNLTDNGSVKGNVEVVNVLAEKQALEGNLVLTEINVDMLKPLVGEYGKAEANINSKIKVSGSVKHPKVTGNFMVDDIVALGDITPIEINKGKLDIQFLGYKAALNADIETKDGILKVDGNAGWEDLQAWDTNLHVFADELKVVIPPMVEVKVKPDMQILMTPDLVKVEGDIYLPWGKIIVEELPSSAVKVSTDEVLLNQELKPVEQNAGLPLALETDVNIHIGDQFELSAFGLSGELVGKLNVTQKDKGPFIVGEIEVNKGEYRSFGQDLQIKEGKILMNGPADQPYLAIKAIRNPENTRDEVVAGIQVTGPANEPVITIFSEPAMPQANALSYLLRGQDIDGKSGGNAMTTALIGLSLAKSGQIVGQIGEAFGVSDLQLDTAGSGDDSQVTVSGYITSDLQVKYGVGIFDSFGEFTVRYRLMKDLYLEAVSGLNSAVDLLYQFEFD